MSDKDLTTKAMLPLYETVLDLLDRYGSGMTEVTDLTQRVRSMLGIPQPVNKYANAGKESNDA